MHRFLNDAETYHLPQPPAAPVPFSAFALCPVPVCAANASLVLAQQMLYQLAFAQAQAVVRPSLPERDLLAVWN